MKELFLKPEFWSAVAGFAWPIALVVVALLFRRFIAQLLSRETVKLKVAGMEISVAEATEQAGKGISDLQERVAKLEQNFAVHAPAETDTPNPEPAISSSILWVDDFPSNNAFIIERLESEGVRVRKELSTDAGIAALAADSFDAIISDLGRQEAGRDNPFAGLDFARAVRAAGNQTPLLIFAGRRGIENRDRLLAAGVSAVTNSPIDVFKFVSSHGGEGQ